MKHGKERKVRTNKKKKKGKRKEEISQSIYDATRAGTVICVMAFIHTKTINLPRIHRKQPKERLVSEYLFEVLTFAQIICLLIGSIPEDGRSK